MRNTQEHTEPIQEERSQKSKHLGLLRGTGVHSLSPHRPHTWCTYAVVGVWPWRVVHGHKWMLKGGMWGGWEVARPGGVDLTKFFQEPWRADASF